MFFLVERADNLAKVLVFCVTGRNEGGMGMRFKDAEKAGSTVTVERNGARSVNLGAVLHSDRAKHQLKEIQKIERSQVNQPETTRRPTV